MFKRILILLTSIFLFGEMTFAQETTGSITGSVRDANGQGLPGATITAVHVPTGTKYATAAKNDGNFTIPNLRVGGPYTITIHFTGYTDQVYTDQQVALGSPLTITTNLTQTSQTLTGVTVSSNRGGVFNAQRNGTSTNITLRQIQSLPSINRSVQDYARLTPQARFGNNGNDGGSTGISFGGQSNRYNQFSIDGANASDAFGLSSSGTNGGQANINPISMEAIQEIQVVMSPYDVTQGGFTGGGINAVSKSGTNTFHGSIYGQYQNQNFVGKSAGYNSTITRTAYPDFVNRTYGASVSGPIIKNKLFFYVNAERYYRSTPVSNDPSDPGSGSKLNLDTLKAIRDFMLKTYGFDLGSYTAFNNVNQSKSVFGRIDWNISDKHKLTVRHNYAEGSNDIGRNRTTSTAYFENTGYKFNSKANSSVIELNSNFSSSASNVLRLTYNNIRDARQTPNAPNLFISNFDVAKGSNISYNLGAENSSAANSLDQDIISVTDNFTLYKGNHTLTFGTSNEFFKSSNVFLQGYYGAYTYSQGGTTSNNLNNWFNNTGLTGYAVGYSTSGRGDKAPAVLKAAQYSLYAQDVWTAGRNFKLTYGVRFDLPVFANKPAVNANFDSAFAAYDVRTEDMPKTRVLISPRVGFNWNSPDEGVQLRGGLGLFTGRVPFVWISNQFSNTGVTTKNLNFTTTTTPSVGSLGVKYTFNPNDPQLGAFIPSVGQPAPTVINVIDKNFKFPQVFRANLGFDKKLGAGFISTFEVLFTKTLNNPYYTNLNISQNGESTVTLGSTTRPYWTKQSLNGNYSQVLKISNTSEGYSWNFTAQIQKTYTKGWSGSLAYNFGTATSINDLPSSVAASNWRGVVTVNGLNNLPLAPSNFDVGSRLTGFISKEFRYAKHFATTFTVFYNGQSGQRMSYVYGTLSSKNITGDDNSSTSLVYIPANETEANFVDISGGATAAQQWANYQAFVASNPYLQKNAGKNAERNGDRLPWENHFDVRIAQDFIFKTHKLQVFFDVVNVGNLLNENWGRAYGSGTTPDGFFPLTTTLFTPVTGTTAQLKKNGNAITTAATANNPAFTFNINNFTKIGDEYKPYSPNNFTSRWSAQVGVRYSF